MIAMIRRKVNAKSGKGGLLVGAKRVNWERTN
jgi:hypothetical protein